MIKKLKERLEKVIELKEAAMRMEDRELYFMYIGAQQEIESMIKMLEG